MVGFVKEACKVGAEIWKHKLYEDAIEFPAKLAWKAYDTYGLPLDMIVEILAEHNRFFWPHQFEQLYLLQRDRSRWNSQKPKIK